LLDAKELPYLGKRVRMTGFGKRMRPQKSYAAVLKKYTKPNIWLPTSQNPCEFTQNVGAVLNEAIVT
jgi:hypothetical protein